MSLGENIRASRTAAGLTQKDLAAALGVARATVINWESGRTHPHAEQVEAIAARLGTTAALLVGDDAHGHATRRRIEHLAALLDVPPQSVIALAVAALAREWGVEQE